MGRLGCRRATTQITRIILDPSQLISLLRLGGKRSGPARADPDYHPGGRHHTCRVSRHTPKACRGIDVPRAFRPRPRHALYILASAGLGVLDEEHKDSARSHLDEREKADRSYGTARPN